MSGGPAAAAGDAPAPPPPAGDGPRLRWLLAAGAIMATAAVVLVLCVRLYDEVVALRAAPRDNVQWSLSQLEVDLARLANAVLAARGTAGPGGEADPAAVAELRRRYDLFYSRVGTLLRGRVFDRLRAEAEVRGDFARLADYLRRTTPVIDGPELGRAETLAELGVGLDALRGPVRALSLEGVRIFAELSDIRRARFEGLLLSAAAVALALITMLGITLAVLLHQYRVSTRRAQEANRSRERLAAAINASLDAIVVVDLAGRVIEFNRAAEQVLGHSRAQALGSPMSEMLVPERYRAGHEAGMRRFAATGEKRVADRGRIELAAMRADGTEIPVEISIGSASDKGGPIFIAYLRDISDRLAAERALTEARDRALAADRAKSEFIAVMSHEMRTPLNGVLGALDLLRNTPLGPRQAEYVSMAIGSGEILLRHINDVLDIARIEAGRIDLDIRPIDLAGLLAGVAEIARPVIEARRNRLELGIEAPRAPIAGDDHRIRQMLINLLGNAAKFTRNGTVTLEARVLAEDAQGAEVELAVRDTGVGIDPADQERIFEDFEMVERGYDRAAQGSGLGLAICRRIVRAMGGRIGVESAPGQGSRFWLRLRLPRAADAAAPGTGGAVAGAGSAPLRILLVEDNETNRIVARDMLVQAGHAVEEAHDGREGVAQAATARFDLILMDIGMPGLDGVEATRAIRAGAGPSRQSRIIGLTAHALPEERRRFAEAGMDGCLTKPVRMPELIAALDPPAARGAAPAPAGPAGGQAWDAEGEADADADMDGEADPLDAEVLSALAAGLPPETVAQVLDRVCAEIDAGLAAMAAALEAGDAAALAREAHRLAGSAAIVGARPLHAGLAAVEAQGRAGDLAAAAATLDAVAAAGAEARALLADFAGSGAAPTAGPAGARDRA